MSDRGSGIKMHGWRTANGFESWDVLLMVATGNLSVLFPDRCQRFTETVLLRRLIQRFPSCIVRSISGCTCVPHGEGNSTDDRLLFNIGTRNQRR